MPTYCLRIQPDEVIRLVHAETNAAAGDPAFYVAAWQDYVIEEDYDRAAYGLHDGNQYDLVTQEARLNIEPRIERNYWVLTIAVCSVIGPRILTDDHALLGAPLTLDAFESGFLAPGKAKVSVRLAAETLPGKKHFDNWWAALNKRHPHDASVVPRTQVPALGKQEPNESPSREIEESPLTDAGTYRTREVVGVFAHPDALEAAVDELQTSGFDRASISVLGTDEKAKDRIGHFCRTVAVTMDNGRAPRTAFASKESRTEGEAAAVAVPLLIGGLVGAAVVAASGGALAVAIAATILGGATGAGIGGLLAHAVARHYSARIEDQLADGGLVLWVAVPNADAEKRALAVLKNAGGREIHVHDIVREWGLRDRPLSTIRMDPFLERDPAP